MIPFYSKPVPHLTTEQMVEVDRAMMEDFRIDLIQMMENAGRALAIVARERFLDADPRGRDVIVLAGSGGNGGGAMAAARRLHGWGANVRVYVTKTIDALTGVPAHQADILRRLGLPIALANRVANADPANVVVDGIIGYSLRGPPRNAAATLIDWANAQPAPVLSLDVPSGVETTTGTAFDPSVRAAATLTLALPKEGLRAPEAACRVGELYLADISVPPDLYARAPLDFHVEPIFAASDIVRLR